MRVSHTLLSAFVLKIVLHLSSYRRNEEADMLTSEETLGARMLKKMGWRPGQGVGPRISWKYRQDIITQGKSIDGVNFDTLEDDQEAKKHTYAPRVAVVPKFSRKDSSFGLGYVPPPNPSETLDRGPEKPGPQLAGEFGLVVTLNQNHTN